MYRAWRYVSDTVRTHPFNFFTLLIAFIAAGFGGWAAWEAHQARLEVRDATIQANKLAERSARAAEESNVLVKRTQASILSVRLETASSSRQIVIKNVSAAVAHNVRADSRLQTSLTVKVLGGLVSASATAVLKELNPKSLVASMGSGETVVLYDDPSIMKALQVDSQSGPGVTARVVLRVVGILEYDDNFRENHKFPFCVLLDPSNRADDECDNINRTQFAKTEPQKSH
jgi:hypothetical protein